MFYGKLIAGLLGLVLGGPFGLVLGVALGHLFDRGLSTTLQFGSPEQVARIKQNFFDTTFLLQGFLAKADGRISEEEIAHTEQVIQQMGLSAQQRQQAIELFRRGAAPDFQPEPVVAQFLELCRAQRQLQSTLLLFLVSLALADNKLDGAEREALGRIARLMGIGQSQLDQLLRMAQAQAHFHGHSGGTAEPGTSLDDAYAALGVGRDVGDKELKRAYRKLMSENHPDKLIARGVPDDMVKLATEKSQEIQSAYEMIRKHRSA